ncbi:hypothetical protein BG006_010476 [Podila minutissima]|uniref:Methyltransferase domain-containing protein n=1 Tax=Podila minutissima TaxID=64525 RepID=A0A9P5SUV1_9FUNG|nr:hypothetical protein BG006_010476 [Podila minutissima]
MKELEAAVLEQDNGSRVWKFVMQHWKAIVQSREHMRKCFKRGEVSVNGSVAEVTKLLLTGDVVRIKFNTRAAHESIYGREKLTVLYEDEELAVVVKPSGKTMVAFGYMLPFSLRPSSMARSNDTEHMDDLPEAEEEEEDDNDESEFQIQQNVSPTVGQQRIPCSIHGLEKASNGLVLVAKTTETRSTLMKMHNSGEINRIFRVICHGVWKKQDTGPDNTSSSAYYDADSTIPIDAECLDAKCIQSIKVISVTESNAAEYLTTLDVKPFSPFLGVSVRRYLMSTQHPVVGNSGNSKPLKANRDKGLCSAVVHVDFIHPTLSTLISLDLGEPTKFQQLRAREKKAYERRQQSDLEELRKGGLENVQNFDRKTERPIAYIVGEKDFFGMRFKVSPATLIPRSSTETLVKATLSAKEERLANKSPVRVLDVGTGSGCLLLAILNSIPGSLGVGVDISQEALDVAIANSAEHSLSDRTSFHIGDMGRLQDSSELFQAFDILVCNPPYLDSSKSAKLTSTFVGTEHEPPVALFAENEGYGAYEMLAKSIELDLKSTSPHKILAPHGLVILEIGNGMGRRVRETFGFMKFERAVADNQDCERSLMFSVAPQE